MELYFSGRRIVKDEHHTSAAVLYVMLGSEIPSDCWALKYSTEIVPIIMTDPVQCGLFSHAVHPQGDSRFLLEDSSNG